MSKIHFKCAGRCTPAVRELFTSTNAVHRAGIIPYKSINGQIYILLGVWYDKDVLTVLGGICEQDETIMDCGVRELQEETINLVNTANIHAEKITHVIPYERFFPQSGNTEKCVAIFIRMDDISSDIERIHKDRLKRKDIKDDAYLEMGTLKWFKYKDISTFKQKHKKIDGKVYGKSHALDQIVTKMPDKF